MYGVVCVWKIVNTFIVHVLMHVCRLYICTVCICIGMYYTVIFLETPTHETRFKQRDFQSEAGDFRFGTETCWIHKGETKTLNRTR